MAYMGFRSTTVTDEAAIRARLRCTRRWEALVHLAVRPLFVRAADGIR
jgi:hypothetical protein